jgi:hypothetical protein
MQKKEQKWRKCVDKYKTGLLKDMDTLKASAQHGLTLAQADTIIDNMRGIQDVYMTADGVISKDEIKPPRGRGHQGGNKSHNRDSK